jgi:hypothetical protein
VDPRRQLPSEVATAISWQRRLRYEVGVPVQIEIELGMTFELRGEIIVTG